jgi:hypothetical protein
MHATPRNAKPQHSNASRQTKRTKPRAAECPAGGMSSSKIVLVRAVVVFDKIRSALELACDVSPSRTCYGVTKG